ncbi:MAG: Gfo/Idh/MocA family oxidoreductase [Actinobacteria bacterium]|nr:Gfo/Idh/MocA family oxidoreductase [Actinomycetota bacterium]
MVRWAIVGFGDIASRAVAPAIQAHPGSTLVAICRRDRDQLEAYARQFGGVQGFTSYEAMLAAGGFEAVYVASPHYLHAPHTLAAIAQGLHVLVEKPMAMTVREATAMVLAAERAGVTLGVAFYHRFYPINVRVRELVASGELGTLIALHGNASSPLSPADLAVPKIRWRLERAQSGGGPLMDVGSHRLDIFYALAGPARRVAAFADRRIVPCDVEDTASLIIQYASGVQATLASAWSVNPARGDYEVWCTDGHINVPYARGSEFTLERHGQSETFTLPPGELHDLPLIADFVDGVEQRATHVLTGAGGLEVQKVIEAAYVSARNATVVTL